MRKVSLPFEAALRVRAMRRRSAILSLVATLMSSPFAAAQQLRTLPREVVIAVHPGMPDIDFVDALVCDLSKVLVAPVRAERLASPVDAQLMASSRAIDPDKFLQTYLATSRKEPQTFLYLLVASPLRLIDAKNADHGLPTSIRTFGRNFGLPYNTAVVSVADLVPAGHGLSRAQVADILERRVYKIILRYIGQAAGGLWRENGCVLHMPRGLAELDAKPAEFCDDDRANLVRLGVLKPQPSGGCVPVS